MSACRILFRQFIADWVRFRLLIKKKHKRRLQTKSCVI